MPLLLLAWIVSTVSQAPTASEAEPVGVARIRREAQALAGQVTTDLASKFLAASASLPTIEPRTLSFDPAKRAYLTATAVEALDPPARAALKTMKVEESFYYNTRYGSPLAYVRPLELLAKAGFVDVAGRKTLDFGYGGIGPLRLLATLGGDAVGVDVDPLLPALYSEPGDRGTVKNPQGRDGRITLIDGRFPADATIREQVGNGYDLILSKNTLKRGYVHPEGPEDKRQLLNLEVDDAAFLVALNKALKPGGWVMIYNLSPAPSPPGQPYKPMADGRSPFAKAAWEAAGFQVVAFDQDDSPAARAMGKTLGWDRGPGAMALETDLFATYTLVRKPMVAADPKP